MASVLGHRRKILILSRACLAVHGKARNDAREGTPEFVDLKFTMSQAIGVHSQVALLQRLEVLRLQWLVILKDNLARRPRT